MPGLVQAYARASQPQGDICNTSVARAASIPSPAAPECQVSGSHQFVSGALHDELAGGRRQAKPGRTVPLIMGCWGVGGAGPEESSDIASSGEVAAMRRVRRHPGASADKQFSAVGVPQFVCQGSSSWVAGTARLACLMFLSEAKPQNKNQKPQKPKRNHKNRNETANVQEKRPLTPHGL